MTQRSNVTLEPFPTMKELARTMLTHVYNAGGHGELFDTAKVLFSTSHAEIAEAFIFIAEEMSDKEMKKEGLCAECGDSLEYKNSLELYNCTNPACALQYNKEAC